MSTNNSNFRDIWNREQDRVFLRPPRIIDITFYAKGSILRTRIYNLMNYLGYFTQ